MTAIDEAELDALEKRARLAEGECILCGGTGELRATTLRDERDTVGCPACIESEAARALSAEKAAREKAERERDEARAACRDGAAMIRRALEWQSYVEAIERDANAAMAEEIQRLRREKPLAEARATTAETEAASLRERVKALEATETAVMASAEVCDALADYHDLQETYAEGFDCPGSAKYHHEQRMRFVAQAAAIRARATLEEKNDG